MEPSERTESTSNEEYTPRVTTVPKKSKTPMVLSVLLLLALVGCGVLGWMVYTQGDQKASLDNKVKAKDSQIADLKADLKSASAAADENSEGTTTDTSSSDSEMLIKAALAYEKAYVNAKNGTLSAKVGKQSGDFAQVTVTTTAGSGATGVYLKKVGTEWVVIGDGSSDMATLKQDFGLPENF